MVVCRIQNFRHDAAHGSCWDRCPEQVCLHACVVSCIVANARSHAFISFSLLVGHKWWVLFPAVVEEANIECDDDCSPESPVAIDWYASVAVNLMRTQYGNNSMPMFILQKPGETIYVPHGMVHSVLNMDGTIAITAGFGSPSNLQTVWENVVRLGAKEQWKRMYYQVLSGKQRRALRQGPIWPPGDFAPGEVFDEDEVEDDYSVDEL